ncbi:hypothetical protein FSP39_006215 [Pinctada imbricata]|uniref:DUF1758 domain-containing protein n=1 Tax=Pinctada imbricata TaxID=66713 RepID=A0AA89BSS8_PINIB|nr:hypothetical protein FSP39_006215 [Pinctada imbricata]
MSTEKGTKSETSNLTATKRKRSTLKGKFHRVYNRFRELRNRESHETLNTILTDMEEAYKDLEKGHACYYELLDPENETDLEEIERIDEDMDKLYSELCDCRSYVRQETEKSKNESKEKTQTVRVKKLDAPCFDGDIRSYPSFKRDYTAIMIPTYGQDPFALKKCLSGEALKTVQGVDYDFTEMMRRLDIKYGRPERIADSILCDIRKLKLIPDGDNLCFINSVETIERCYLDLKRMNLEREMNSATMISEIEKILPSLQKREWILQKQKHGLTDFGSLLKFLLDEKIAMEYMMSEIRSTQSQCQGPKARVHHTDIEPNSQECTSLSVQMQHNQNMLQKVVEGLAHITEIVSQGGLFPDSQRIHPQKPPQMRCWYHGSDTHDITECWHFARLDVNAKYDLLKRSGGCFICLRLGHIAKMCMNKTPCDHCNKMHHTLLHADNVQGSSNSILNKADTAKFEQNVILMVSEVSCKNDTLTTLWDPGSNISLITHSIAHKLNLPGQSVTLSVTKVGNTAEHLHTKEYVVPLCDQTGKIWQIRAYGIDEITANIAKVEISEVTQFFPKIKNSDIYRPYGKVHLLVGSDCCAILPVKVDNVGNLQLLQNQFGYCLRGSHEKLQISATSNQIQINHFTGFSSELNSVHVVDTETLQEKFDHFFDIESLGTYSTPRCGGCKCGNCGPGSGNFTLEEEKELHLIENGLSFDDKNKCWVISYPWKRNPNDLPNNIKSAVGRMKSTEQRIKKMGSEYTIQYQRQIEDMLDRQVARKLSFKEMHEHIGPIHYIPHHEVLKPESLSTPVRIVFNSSASYMGHVLNNYWAKGPKILNDLLSILLRFREGQIAIVGDIAKMYNSIHLTHADQHTHRFLWRDLPIIML